MPLWVIDIFQIPIGLLYLGYLKYDKQVAHVPCRVVVVIMTVSVTSLCRRSNVRDQDIRIFRNRQETSAVLVTVTNHPQLTISLYNKSKMVKDMSYHQISTVLETWELARQQLGCEEQLATETLLNLFDLEPATKTVFGFRPEQNVKANPMFMMGALTHGKLLISMIDSVLSLLGPDTEMLDELLSHLGERHLRLGVKVEYFPILEKAISKALGNILGKKWTKDRSEAWFEVFKELSNEIAKGMVKTS